MPTPSFPSPPFSLDQYPMQPVSGANAQDWVDQMWGTRIPGWSSASQLQFELDAATQSVSSFPESGLQSIIISTQGRENAQIQTISYVCVSGPGAEYVDVAIYPASTKGAQYQGWNGSAFADGPAVDSGEHHYWYRLEIDWVNADQSDMVYPVFYAKAYRYKDGEAPPFQIQMFNHPIAAPTPPTSRKLKSDLKIPHLTAYDFGQGAFSVMAVVSPQTMGAAAQSPIGTLLATSPLEGKGSWQLAIVQDPEGQAAGTYLSFTIQGPAGETQSILSAFNSRYIDKPGQPNPDELLVADQVFHLMTHTIAVVRKTNGAMQLYLNGYPQANLLTIDSPVSLDVSNGEDIMVGPLSSETSAPLPNVLTAALWNKALSQEEVIYQMNYMGGEIALKAKASPPNYTMYAGNRGGTALYKFVGTIAYQMADANGIQRRGSGSFEYVSEHQLFSAEEATVVQARLDALEAILNQLPDQDRYRLDFITETFYFNPVNNDDCVGRWLLDHGGKDQSSHGNDATTKTRFPSPEHDVVLPFYMEDQKTHLWCWAATSVSTSRFYHPPGTWTQCSLASEAMGYSEPGFGPLLSERVNCCDAPTPSDCVQGFPLSLALKVAGKHYRGQQNRQSNPIKNLDPDFLASVRSELLQRRPVGVALRFGGVDKGMAQPGQAIAIGETHFVMITGIVGNELIVSDSFNGIHKIRKGVFPSTYQYPGTDIIMVYFTQPTPNF